ncbi:N(alpha)-acetyltransferase 38, NatC auxiliary [Tyrophagus putrescentiae]|nr:N(alpha)-acetyltransferase 38, NatC auxiliary [Tyrophagus putrescentiae]
MFSPDNPTVTREVSTATTTTRVVTVLLAKAECSQSSPDEEPEQWSGLVLTSGRCVEAIERALQLDDVPNRAELLQRWSTLAIFTVGEATRRRLLERLAPFALTPSSRLWKGKVALEEIACYQTVASDRLEAEVQQLSPSGVDHLMPVLSRVFGLQRSDDDNSVIKVKFVAFGRSTAARLESGSQNASVWFTVSRPTAEDIFEQQLQKLEQLEQLQQHQRKSETSPPPPPHRKVLEKWLNKNMKIKMSDSRTIVGNFLCTDRHLNIILGSSLEYLKDGESLRKTKSLECSAWR